MPTHRVRFQPVNIEIEVNEDETVLNAAFRQGVSLTHGCREGQCSACKSFLLDGDLEMERYSTFALPEYESEEGYVLLCRSHAYSDLEVELINYDEDILRLGIPIVTLQTTVEEITALTHDIKRLVLKFTEPGKKLQFHAGQDLHRSPSLAARSPALTLWLTRRGSLSAWNLSSKSFPVDGFRVSLKVVRVVSLLVKQWRSRGLMASLCCTRKRTVTLSALAVVQVWLPSGHCSTTWQNAAFSGMPHFFTGQGHGRICFTWTILSS